MERRRYLGAAADIGQSCSPSTIPQVDEASSVENKTALCPLWTILEIVFFAVSAHFGAFLSIFRSFIFIFYFLE